MDCFDDLGDKFGRRSRSSSQVKTKTKSKVNKKKKKTRMGKIIPFSTCLRLNKSKKRKGSDEPIIEPSITSLKARGASTIAGEEVFNPELKQKDQSTLPATSLIEPLEASKIEPGKKTNSLIPRMSEKPSLFGGLFLHSVHCSSIHQYFQSVMKLFSTFHLIEDCVPHNVRETSFRNRRSSFPHINLNNITICDCSSLFVVFCSAFITCSACLSCAVDSFFHLFSFVFHIILSFYSFLVGFTV